MSMGVSKEVPSDRARAAGVVRSAQASADWAPEALADGPTSGFPELCGALAGLRRLEAADFDRYREEADIWMLTLDEE